MTALQALQPTVENIHGTRVEDPFRGLETRTSTETKQWIASQGEMLENYFAHGLDWDFVQQRASQLLNATKVDQLQQVADRLFFRRRDQRSEQPSIFVRDLATGDEHCLVDPSGWGKWQSVGIYSISDDAILLAYEVKVGGEHTKEIRLLNVKTGGSIPFCLKRGHARGLVFASKCDSLYYCHESIGGSPSASSEHAIMRHRMSQSSGDDEIILTVPRKQTSKLVLCGDSTVLQAYYFFNVAGRSFREIYLALPGARVVWQRAMSNLAPTVIPLLYGDVMLGISHTTADNGAIVRLDIDGNEKEIVIPECGDKISRASIVGDKLVVTYLRELSHAVRVWTTSGQYIEELPLPKQSSAMVWPCSPLSDTVFVQVESFSQPPAIFSYSVRRGQTTSWPTAEQAVEASRYRTRCVWYRSKDGTPISMFLVGRDRLDMDMVANRPVVMTAYGGFGAEMTPHFSVFTDILLELGFVFALPHIRGGSEYGRSWHESARGSQHQVSFDDFICAAQYLSDHCKTSPGKLAIFGGSHSGLLVAVAMTQRPELFGAVVCVAPLLDMVRYHLFDSAAMWADEYGTSEDPKQFKALHQYSPYHQVRQSVHYPSTLFVTGDKDTRCNPAHVRKMAALLQSSEKQVNPVLVDYSEMRGHSPTMPLSARIRSLARRVAFVCKELDVPLATNEDQL
jgi:prolyl oligopeptidase